MCGLRDIADTRAGVSVLPAASGMTSASVDGVLACVVFVPSAPLLVPELAGPDAVDTLEARSAVRDAGVLLARHATRWVAVGADDFIAPVRSDDFIAPVRSGDDAAAGDPLASRSIPTVGGFGRFGVDVPVSLERVGGERPPGRLPLSMLIAGWLRGQVDAESVRPVVVDPDVRPEVACELGRALSAEISSDPEPIGYWSWPTARRHSPRRRPVAADVTAPSNSSSASSTESRQRMSTYFADSTLPRAMPREWPGGRHGRSSLGSSATAR